MRNEGTFNQEAFKDVSEGGGYMRVAHAPR